VILDEGNSRSDSNWRSDLIQEIIGKVYKLSLDTPLYSATGDPTSVSLNLQDIWKDVVKHMFEPQGAVPEVHFASQYGPYTLSGLNCINSNFLVDIVTFAQEYGNSKDMIESCTSSGSVVAMISALFGIQLLATKEQGIPSSVFFKWLDAVKPIAGNVLQEIRGNVLKRLSIIPESENGELENLNVIQTALNTGISLRIFN
jgi:hypothetical protein